MVQVVSLFDYLEGFGEGRSNRRQVKDYPKLGRHGPYGSFGDISSYLVEQQDHIHTQPWPSLWNQLCSGPC